MIYIILNQWSSFQGVLYITETFSMSKLPESHAKKLLPTGKIFDFVVSIIPSDKVFKLLIRSKFHQLSKDHLALIHVPDFAQSKAKAISNL